MKTICSSLHFFLAVLVSTSSAVASTSNCPQALIDSLDSERVERPLSRTSEFQKALGQLSELSAKKDADSQGYIEALKLTMSLAESDQQKASVLMNFGIEQLSDGFQTYRREALGRIAYRMIDSARKQKSQDLPPEAIFALAAAAKSEDNIKSIRALRNEFKGLGTQHALAWAEEKAGRRLGVPFTSMPSVKWNQTELSKELLKTIRPISDFGRISERTVGDTVIRNNVHRNEIGKVRDFLNSVAPYLVSEDVNQIGYVLYNHNYILNGLFFELAVKAPQYRQVNLSSDLIQRTMSDVLLHHGDYNFRYRNFASVMGEFSERYVSPELMSKLQQGQGN